MYFITVEELDCYLVFILFMFKKKKSLPSKKKPEIFWVREIFKKKAAYGLYSNLVYELRIGDREFHFK